MNTGPICFECFYCNLLNFGLKLVAVPALTSRLVPCLCSAESVTLSSLSSYSHPNPVCPADMEPLFKDKVGRKWHQNTDLVIINLLIIDQ